MNSRESNIIRTGLILLLLFLGCDSKKEGDSSSPMTAITISPVTPNVIVGQTLKVSAFGVTASGRASGEGLPVTWTSNDTSVATVNTDGVVLGKAIGVVTLVASYNGLSTTATVGVVSSTRGAANLTVAGFSFYEDKPYTVRGFTGALVNQPIRQAIVNLIAIDQLTILASTTTKNDGSYQFSAIDNSPRQGGIYVQVVAKTEDTGLNPITVMESATHRSVLALRSTPLDDSLKNSFSLDIVAPASGIGGAFNILDIFLKGGEFIQGMRICPPDNAICQWPLLTAYWMRGEGHSTFYENSPTHHAVTISGGLSDTDEYDDTVIAHEYGHFVAVLFSRDDSPGGAHTYLNLVQDIRLAWSEGWATFFGAAMLGSPLYVDPSQNLRYSIETLSDVFYTTSESAVSRVLWDIFDAGAQDDDHDPMTTGFAPIWKAVMEMKPQPAPATIESFVVTFEKQNPATALQTVLKSARIELFPDAAETLETPPVVGQYQHHTLYVSGTDPFSDQDGIPLSVVAGQSYTVRTINLTNGADTFLKLEESGVVRAQNDNIHGGRYPLECGQACPPNDSIKLSSAISFVAGTGPLFVVVQRSPDAPLSAGRAGSYDILLTTP